MKNHLNFLKGVSLTGLAIATLSLTCLGLSSCGGGGGDETTSDAQRAAEYMENKTLELQGANASCFVTMSERMRGTSILEAQIKYGYGTPVQGNLIVEKATFNGEDLQTARVKLPTKTSSISSETDYKSWWGVPAGNGNLVFSGDTYVDMTVTGTNGNGCTGSFDAVTVTITKDDNGTETETEKKLPGAYFQLN